ncbi:MAG: ABC transporter substrate-binding protein [Actinomycetota bacterium]|nr:ABC transporter substrate-binding protein [Actinomycetota bacterium]
MVVDAKSDQTAAVQGARRLVEQERVAAIIGPTSTPAAGAIKDYVNGRRVPLLANVGSIPGEIPPFVFKVGVQPESIIIARVKDGRYELVATADEVL